MYIPGVYDIAKGYFLVYNQSLAHISSHKVVKVLSQQGVMIHTHQTSWQGLRKDLYTI